MFIPSTPSQCPSLDADPDPTRLSRFPVVVPYSKKGRKTCRQEAFSKDGFVSLSIPSETAILYYQVNLVPKGMLVSMTILFSNKKQLRQMGKGGLEPCCPLGCWPARPSVPNFFLLLTQWSHSRWVWPSLRRIIPGYAQHLALLHTLSPWISGGITHKPNSAAALCEDGAWVTAISRHSCWISSPERQERKIISVI